MSGHAIDRRRFVAGSAAMGAGALLPLQKADAQYNPDFDVIIIGAGIAGLAAARDLAEQDLKVLVLEARQRTGGRIYTAEDDVVFHGVELGAQFIHGTEADTWELINEFSIQTMALSDLGEPEYRTFSPGNPNAVPDLARVESAQEAIYQRFAAYRGEDSDLLDWMRVQDFGVFEQSVATRSSLSFSAEPDRMSARAAIEDGAAWEAYRDENYKVMGGYSRIIDRLQAELRGKIRLDAPVKETVWAEGIVGVYYNDRGLTSSVTGRSLISTLPIGVLQAETIKITPPLPPWKLDAINAFEMGQVVVVPMQFSTPFWRDKIPEPGGWIGDSGRIQLWVPHSQSRGGSSILGWFTGNAAKRLSGLGEEPGMQQVMDWLSQASGETGLANLLTWHRFQDWQKEPYTLGSYSFPRPNGGEQREPLQRNVSDTLFFAGEATAPAPHYQTVHGAYASGKRAALEVVGALRKRAMESGEFDQKQPG